MNLPSHGNIHNYLLFTLRDCSIGVLLFCSIFQNGTAAFRLCVTFLRKQTPDTSTWRNIRTKPIKLNNWNLFTLVSLNFNSQTNTKQNALVKFSFGSLIYFVLLIQWCVLLLKFYSIILNSSISILTLIVPLADLSGVSLQLITAQWALLFTLLFTIFSFFTLPALSCGNEVLSIFICWMLLPWCSNLWVYFFVADSVLT